MPKKKLFWDFDTVVKEFDNHISKSVPGYIECRNLVSDISVFFRKKIVIFMILGALQEHLLN